MPNRIQPAFADFERQQLAGTVGVLSLDLPADLETPVSAYLKLAAAAQLEGKPMGFLLESVERGQAMGRYSFIATGIARSIEMRGQQVELADGDTKQSQAIDPADPLRAIREALEANKTNARVTPPLLGGAVGYLSYDLVRHFERLPQLRPDMLGLPDGFLLIPDTVVVFDHARRAITIVTQVPESGTPSERYKAATARIEAAREALAGPLKYAPPAAEVGCEPQSNFTQAQFEQAVVQAKEHIAAGDIFQIVLSQRLNGKTTAEPFQIYRALRLLNPSPYMFFLDFGDLKLIGSSPEALVKLEGRSAMLNPIAGTRPRGATPEQDAELEAELLASDKEVAEHVMLVDLARNDLGRVCTAGSVRVPQFKAVERFSHVMHIVSNVTGELTEGRDGFDLFRAAFPAGTVSGAPKIRAMELIEEIEPDRRGPYSGAVGYFGANGDMDMCIAIRTIVMQGQRYHLQAGAGIVADSDPQAEYQETLAKMAGLQAALRLAEEGL